MIWLWAILLVLSPAVLYALALALAAIRIHVLPPRCPACHRRSLRQAGAIRETYPTGKGTGSFYQCESCGKKWFWANDDHQWHDSTDSPLVTQAAKWR